MRSSSRSAKVKAVSHPPPTPQVRWHLLALPLPGPLPELRRPPMSLHKLSWLVPCREMSVSSDRTVASQFDGLSELSRPHYWSGHLQPEPTAGRFVDVRRPCSPHAAETGLAALL